MADLGARPEITNDWSARRCVRAQRVGGDRDDRRECYREAACWPYPLRGVPSERNEGISAANDAERVGRVGDVKLAAMRGRNARIAANQDA